MDGASLVPEAARAAPRFHALRVADVRRETPDAVSIAFEVPASLADAYRFLPGQYLTLRRAFDGTEERRSYSICSGPEELRIGVKRVDGGLFSTWLNAELRPGDVVDVMTPTGRFGQVERAGEVSLGFAAGSGITPVLAIARATLSATGRGRFLLFYGNRSANDIMFRDELEQLKDRYLDRFSVFHVLSREEQDLPILNGRLDAEKASRLVRAMVPVPAIGHVFLCGPTEMSEALEPALVALGVPPERIHLERFVSQNAGKPRARSWVAPEAPPAHIAAITLDGKRREIGVAAGETVLDAALRAGMDLPFACKGGMCSTCRARVVAGEVRMDVNFSLEPWETEAGYVLTCQSHPVTDRVSVDFDEV